jgi:DNA-binding transcriptional ArsR family regulator
MRPDAPTIVLTRAAGDVRRQLPASAWIALESLATEAVDSHGEVQTTVRKLGERVGLNKDTVARALQVLMDAGLVARVDRRDGASGQFGSSTYRVELAAAGFSAPRPEPSDAATTTFGAPTVSTVCSSTNEPTTRPDDDDRRASRRPDVDPNQLSLIDP